MDLKLGLNVFSHYSFEKFKKKKKKKIKAAISRLGIKQI